MNSEGSKQDSRIYEIDGMMRVEEHFVLPGIVLQKMSARTRRMKIDERMSQSGNDDPGSLGTKYVINHCGSGRVEFARSNYFFYLGEGDLAISVGTEQSAEVYFPQGYFEGIAIIIDKEKSQEAISSYINEVSVSPAQAVERFLENEDYYITRSNPSIQHIFSELYSVPESIKEGYYKIKVMALLMFLSEMQMPENKEKRRKFNRSQVLLAKGVCEYLTMHMDKHITIEALAEAFHISGTQLKSTFKGVYGDSIYSYIRRQKMEAAANLLRESNETILDIAGRFGYENGSKFAKAFRDTMGMSPKVYRNKAIQNSYQTNKINDEKA